jgi:bacteriocin biosynthesis cyclodehydratase domain-containing protein
LSLARSVSAAAEYASAAIPDYPRLAPWVVAFDLGDGRLELRGSVTSFTLPHPFFASVFRTAEKYLDGSYTADAVADALSGEIDRSAVLFLLKMLTACGLLVAGKPRPSLLSEPQSRFFQQVNRDASRVIAALEAKTLRIVAEDRMAASIASLLRQAGLPEYGMDVEAVSAPDHVPAAINGHLDLVVAVAGGLSDRLFVAVNEQCLKTGTRWLSAAISGPQARLGPTFVPDHTACYTCFRHRLNSNAADPAADRAFEAAVAHYAPEQGGLEAFSAIIAGHVALEAVRLLTGLSEPSTIARYYLFNASAPDSEVHNVLRVPRCPSCGSSNILRRAWDTQPADGEEL